MTHPRTIKYKSISKKQWTQKTTGSIDHFQLQMYVHGGGGEGVVDGWCQDPWQQDETREHDRRSIRRRVVIDLGEVRRSDPPCLPTRPPAPRHYKPGQCPLIPIIITHSWRPTVTFSILCGFNHYCLFPSSIASQLQLYSVSEHGAHGRSGAIHTETKRKFS